MATYIEINGVQYEASITGRLNDKDWNGRASKAIRLTMTYAEAMQLFVNDIEWYITQDIEMAKEVIGEDGEPYTEFVVGQERYDNSEYCIAGEVIDHRDGTVTVKMGKPTAEELLAMLEEVL